MRLVLGDAYVDALRLAHKDVPDSCDYVMYWWNKAANLARAGKVRRFGFITTNSITQVFNRRTLKDHLEAKNPLSILFAIPNHPWVDSENGAAVRIAMTVCTGGHLDGQIQIVAKEIPNTNEETLVETESFRGRINPDLTVGVNVSDAKPLRSNMGVCGQGIKVVGEGFYAGPELSMETLSPQTGAPVIRPIVNTRDIIANRKGNLVIDFFGLNEKEARLLHPAAYQQTLTRVKPIRDQNKRESIRRLWWRFAWERPVHRAAMKGLKHYLVTLSTSKHRFFVPLSTTVLWDGALFGIALEDLFFLAVLSSRVHKAWSLAAGGRIGVGNDPTWTNKTCFDPFPFPVCLEEQIIAIRALGESLDAHRKRQQTLHPKLTLTGMYNVLEKLRSGEPLNEKEKVIHEQGLVSVLKQIHDDLDAAVFDAYGWPSDLTDEQILERLVALNAKRAEEERNGLVRWLRPEFQNPSGTREETQVALPGTAAPDEEAATAPTVAPWPKKLPEQVATVRDLLLAGHAWGVEQVAKAFKGARRREVEGVLESLVALGLAVTYDTPEGRRWRGIEGGALGDA